MLIKYNLILFINLFFISSICPTFISSFLSNKKSPTICHPAAFLLPILLIFQVHDSQAPTLISVVGKINVAVFVTMPGRDGQML
jgi:hypothetical protein